MKFKIIPTVFAKNDVDFSDKLEMLLDIKSVKEIQIDFMDGKFVSEKSVSLEDIPDLKHINCRFEAHLMVSNPRKWIKKLKGKNFDKILYHFEALPSIKKINSLNKEIEKESMETWIVFNPETETDRILEIIEGTGFKGIMLMGVHPGKEGQELERDTIDKIKAIKRNFPDVLIQVDGGIDDKTIVELARAGLDIANSGSFVTGANDAKKALDKLDKGFRKGLSQIRLDVD